MSVHREILIVWRILSSIILIMFISLITFKNSLILFISPQCYSVKVYNSSCFFCGMTRAFIMIKNLNFDLAFKYNQLSLLLFMFLLINTIYFISSFKKYFYENS